MEQRTRIVIGGWAAAVAVAVPVAFAQQERRYDDNLLDEVARSGAAAGVAASSAAQPADPMQQAQAAAPEPAGEALVMFDFERNNLEEWAIPDWAKEKPDNAGKDLVASTDFASHGQGSAQLMAEFPGRAWSGAYLERMMYVTDWSQFRAIAADIYLPYNVPEGLGARIILTVGEDWTWTEMNRTIPLKPDQWTTVTANLKPGSLDWKFFPDDAFRRDVRKIGIRIEANGPPAYTGPVFVDNIRLLK